MPFLSNSNSPESKELQALALSALVGAIQLIDCSGQLARHAGAQISMVAPGSVYREPFAGHDWAALSSRPSRVPQWPRQCPLPGAFGGGRLQMLLVGKTREAMLSALDEK